jgi:exosortase
MDYASFRDALGELNLNKKNVAAFFLVLVCFSILFQGIFASLVKDWANDDNYSHGFLIIPIAIFFAWERRHRFIAAKQEPSVWGAIVFFPAIIAAVLNMHPFVNRMALWFCLIGILLFLFGWARLKVVAFPALFLLLMIPIPAIILNPLIFPLQLLASRFGAWTLEVCQIPVLREGNVIQLANTSLEVVEACSGIRSLISLLTLGILYGYFVESRIWIRILLALASIPVAIAANAFRVAGTGIAAHFIGPEAAEGFFHAFSGWFVFIIAFVLLFILHRLLIFWKPVPKKPID